MRPVIVVVRIAEDGMYLRCSMFGRCRGLVLRTGYGLLEKLAGTA